MNIDMKNASLALRRANAQFDSVFGRFSKQRVVHVNSRSTSQWINFRPSKQNVAFAANIPRLCTKCRGSKCAAKLPDPFPLRSSAGCVWFRYDVSHDKGQVCVPTIRDGQLGDIYTCQLCGKLIHHKGAGGQVSMYQIFQDLYAEIGKTFYNKKPKTMHQQDLKSGQGRKTSKLKLGDFILNPLKIDNTDCRGDFMPNFAKADKPTFQPRVGHWELLLGNVLNPNRSPVKVAQWADYKFLRNSHAPMICTELHIEPLNFIATNGADIRDFECSFNIWEKKAKERKFQADVMPKPLSKPESYERTFVKLEPVKVRPERKESPVVAQLLEQQCNLSHQIAEWVLSDSQAEHQKQQEEQQPEEDYKKVDILQKDHDVEDLKPLEVEAQEADEGYEGSKENLAIADKEIEICSGGEELVSAGEVGLDHGDLYTKSFCIITVVTMICCLLTFLQSFKLG